MALYFSPLGSDALCTSGHPMLALKYDRPCFDGTGKTFVDQTPSVENPYHPVIVSDEILMLGQVTTVSRRLQCRARTIRNTVRSRLIRSSKTDDFHVPRPSSQSSLPIFYVRQAWAYLFQVVLGPCFFRSPHPMRSSADHIHSGIDQNRRPPIVKGGSPAKKRHMRSPPPFALHLQYAPKSGSDWKPSCGITPPLPSKGNLPETVFPRYMPTVGPSDDSALNPGMFISCSFRIVNFIRHNTAAFFSQVQRQNTLLSPGPRIQQRA
jgi:hypothetical protein